MGKLSAAKGLYATAPEMVGASKLVVPGAGSW